MSVENVRGQLGWLVELRRNSRKYRLRARIVEEEIDEEQAAASLCAIAQRFPWPEDDRLLPPAAGPPVRHCPVVPPQRSRIFRIHKPLYAAIGEPDNRHRKPTPLPRAIERLMVLDAVLADQSGRGSRRSRTSSPISRSTIAYPGLISRR